MLNLDRNYAHRCEKKVLFLETGAQSVSNGRCDSQKYLVGLSRSSLSSTYKVKMPP